MATAPTPAMATFLLPRTFARPLLTHLLQFSVRPVFNPVTSGRSLIVCVDIRFTLISLQVWCLLRPVGATLLDTSLLGLVTHKAAQTVGLQGLVQSWQSGQKTRKNEAKSRKLLVDTADKSDGALSWVSCEFGDRLCSRELCTMRRIANMNVGAGGNAGHGCTKREIRYALALQITNQRLTLRTIRMQRHVNGVAVIVAEPIMSG